LLHPLLVGAVRAPWRTLTKGVGWRLSKSGGRPGLRPDRQSGDRDRQRGQGLACRPDRDRQPWAGWH